LALQGPPSGIAEGNPLSCTHPYPSLLRKEGLKPSPKRDLFFRTEGVEKANLLIFTPKSLPDGLVRTGLKRALN